MVKSLDSYVLCKIVTLREMCLSYKEIKEKLGHKSRSTAQTAYQRFFENELLCGQRTSGAARKAQRKRAKTNSSKSGKRPKRYRIVSRKTVTKFNLNKKN